MPTRTLTLTFALLAAAALTACSPTPTAVEEAASSPEETVAAPETAPVCPPDLIASFEANYEVIAPVETSFIGDVFGTELPEAACALVSDNSSDVDMDSVLLFWPDQDQNFANEVGNTLVAAGSVAFGEPITYQKDAAKVTLYAYPAGDPLHWGEYFDGFPQLVMGHGSVPNTGLVD